MKTKIPWILCLVMSVALLTTNWPQLSVPNEKMPQDFSNFNLSQGTRWNRIYKRNDLEIWKLPASGPEGCRHGESYVVTHDSRIFAGFSEDSSDLEIYQKGHQIARFLPETRTGGNGMRFSYCNGPDGWSYTLVDIDGDGIVDFKRSVGRAWIYKHGYFVESDSASNNHAVKRLLDGTSVSLKNGQWVSTSSKTNSPNKVLEETARKRAVPQR